MLQCVETRHAVDSCSIQKCCIVLQYIACCSVSQHITLCCSMLQHVAACCSMSKHGTLLIPVPFTHGTTGIIGIPRIPTGIVCLFLRNICKFPSLGYHVFLEESLGYHGFLQELSASSLQKQSATGIIEISGFAVGIMCSIISRNHRGGVATISKLLKIVRLFCKQAL